MPDQTPFQTLAVFWRMLPPAKQARLLRQAHRMLKPPVPKAPKPLTAGRDPARSVSRP